MNQETVKFCPGCGGASITESLLDKKASCELCNWAGPVEELVAANFSQDIGSPEEVLRQLTLDIRKVLSERAATELIRMLLKWGFMGPTVDKREAARYLGGIAMAIAQGIIQVRQTLEEERVTKG